MERNRRPSIHTLLLLEALSKRSRAWHYGYELSQITGLKSGTLYPILMRLCDRGHVYRLTAAGVAFARSAIAADAGVQKRAAPDGALA
jgi:PadR family transcriptional regulator PadR